MELFLHITYSGAGGMTEAVLTLLEAGRLQPDSRHLLLFYGTDALPGRIQARCERLGIPYELIQKGPGNDWPSLSRMLRLLRRLQPDVVYSHMTQPLPALFFYRLTHPSARIISIEHHSNALKTPKDWLLTGANHSLADHSIYLTPQYREEVRRRLGPLFRPGRTSVIPNGIDTDRFAPRPQPAPSHPLLVGMPARMVPGKDFATLLRSFALVLQGSNSLPVRLQLAGDGPERAGHEALCAELGILHAVDFLGEVSQEELIRVMQSWHIFVLSTLGETMSRSIMEAQSMALPIVSTRVPGVTSAVNSGQDGLLVDPRDPAAMAAGLLELLRSPSLRQSLGQAARAKALRDYSSAEVWRRYGALTQSLFSN